jgi:hypothetical protein
MSAYTNSIIAIGATSGAVTYYLTKSYTQAAIFASLGALGFVLLDGMD